MYSSLVLGNLRRFCFASLITVTVINDTERNNTGQFIHETMVKITQLPSQPASMLIERCYIFVHFINGSIKKLFTNFKYFLDWEKKFQRFVSLIGLNYSN